MKAFARRAQQDGLIASVRRAALTRLIDPTLLLPLSRVNRLGMFNLDVAAVHAKQREESRASSLLNDASNVERSYPLTFELEGRALRYAYLPAKGTSRGLVTLFHGHNAFLHLGPMQSWHSFDILAPWDTFGWQRQGSWFWGEKGDPLTERLVQALIEQFRGGADRPWFCMGGSMGGFGALWHGIKFASNGMYVMCPQIDLARKILDFSDDPSGNPYAFLQGSDGALPDLLAVAQMCHELPPIFLVQNQYDFVNPFADHAFRLLEIYNQKRGWYGLRVHPSTGHGGDGSQAEAEMFFSLLSDIKPSCQAIVKT